MAGGDLDGPSTLLAPAMAGTDYRKKLEALRDRLAEAIDGASPRQLIHVAPLSKQLTEVLRLLEEIPNAEAPADSVETAQEDVERILRAVQ